MEEWPTLPLTFETGVYRPMTVQNSSFDPYQVMLKKKNRDDDNISSEVIQYDENDVYELEKFCKEHNILGFNCGKMSPKSALNMLKSKIGVKTENVLNKKILWG